MAPLSVMPATEYARGAQHVYRHIAGEHLLIDLRSKSEVPFFAFTPSAVYLWEEMSDWVSFDQLVGRLRRHYDVADEQAEADVREFLEQLESIGALSRREAAT